ncbi:MAG: EutN/CcmL family microcompartment protein, partial [Candidatus Poribacteria bacterium]|nr:EutN/CcmL family microcompartment protein [Candidatus Poribacteria bacterium]
MTLGKVVGTVVATCKDEKLIGNRLMIVQEV